VSSDEASRLRDEFKAMLAVREKLESMRAERQRQLLQERGSLKAGWWSKEPEYAAVEARIEAIEARLAELQESSLPSSVRGPRPPYPMSPSARPLAAAPARTGYEPYPVALVEELERLTRERSRPPERETPAQHDDRQRRIDELVAELKRNKSPIQGDVVVGVRLVRILGKGNFGVVWQGTDTRTGEARAVKVFDSDRLGLTLSLYHFRRGVRFMEKLNAAESRPNCIVKLYEVEPSNLAFSMQCVDGGDLTNVARRGWSLDKKLEVFGTVCAAVRFAHGNNVIHRDLKPANIVMTGDGKPVLTDFDISDHLAAISQTVSGHSGGTTFYAAPEQLEGKGARERTCDVYSLGRLLHYLLIERDPPFVFEDTPRLVDLKEQPEGLVRIIRKCTMRTPSQRYDTVDALVAEVGRHASEPQAVGCAPPTGAEPPLQGQAAAEAKWREAVALAAVNNFEGACAAGEKACDQIKSIDDSLWGQWSRQLTDWKAQAGDKEAFDRAARRRVFGRLPLWLTIGAFLVLSVTAIVSNVPSDIRKWMSAESTPDPTGELNAILMHHSVTGRILLVNPGIMTPTNVLTNDSFDSFCNVYRVPASAQPDADRADYDQLRHELVEALAKRKITVEEFLKSKKK
jgi:tRNA A-37 threonylcarbamoyl transferase component Bud32